MQTRMRGFTYAGIVVVALGCSPPEPSTAPAPGSEGASDATRTSAAPSQTLGFVVSAWRDEIPDTSPADCPEGLNVTEVEYFGIDTDELKREIAAKGIQGGMDAVFPPDACADPTAQPDPGFKIFEGDGVPVAGLDLDGRASRDEEGAACAHLDFVDADGATGIDNQFWRLVGCTSGYQKGGLIDRLYRSGNFVKEGIPILLQIEGVDDVANDEDVRVRMFSSRDPTELDGVGNVKRDLSLQVHDDPRFHSALAKGRIRDGVLTTDPFDVRLHLKQQVIESEFYYRDLRVRAKLEPDGRLAGLLGFYWDGENLFRVNNDHEGNGRHTGRGAAIARGYMCAGMYHAIQQVADGHPDPKTGQCTSVSSAIHFEAVPAFVLESEVAES